MKKIIIIGPAYPLRGGIANFNEALCTTLNESGADCSIVSFTLQYPGFLFPGTTQKAEGDDPPQGLKITEHINSVNPFSWFKTASFIAAQKPDLVLIRYWIPFMGPCLGTIARRIKKQCRQTRIVAIADNIIPHERRAGDRALTSYFVKSCDAFVVMSKSVMDDLKQFDATKPVVMQPHPVYNIFGNPVPRSVARQKLGLADHDRVVLFFGFIRKYKGLDLLLHAFADDLVRKLNIRLLIAGEFYDDKAFYTDLISTLNLSENVILHDKYIPKNEVANYFCASDLVAQPYRDATQSGVTQIAYHFSKPMLVTNVGGLPEIVTDGKSGYVTPVTPEGIATAIADFYEQSREQALSKGAAELARNFSWKAFAEAVTSFNG